MQGEGDKLGEVCINKKKPRGDDLENLQLLQTAKTATFRRFTVRNARSKEKLRVWISNVLDSIHERLKGHTEDSLKRLRV